MLINEPLHDNHVYECTTHPCKYCANPNVTCMTTGNAYHIHVEKKGFWCIGKAEWQHVDYMICDRCNEAYKKCITWENDTLVLKGLAYNGVEDVDSIELHLCPECTTYYRKKGLNE